MQGFLHEETCRMPSTLHACFTAGSTRTGATSEYEPVYQANAPHAYGPAGSEYEPVYQAKSPHAYAYGPAGSEYEPVYEAHAGPHVYGPSGESRLHDCWTSQSHRLTQLTLRLNVNNVDNP